MLRIIQKREVWISIFKVGSAIGVLEPNETSMVDELMDPLLIPRTVRDRPIIVKTTGGRWPTVWGDDKPRELVSTQRAILQWTTDIQSYPPTKPLLHLAEHASDENEKKILTYLTTHEGQGAFCRPTYHNQPTPPCSSLFKTTLRPPPLNP